MGNGEGEGEVGSKSSFRFVPFCFRGERVGKGVNNRRVTSGHHPSLNRMTNVQ